MKKISVVIPVFNDNQYIINLVKYLERAENRDKFEMVIVDGGSKESPRITKSPSIRIIRSPQAGRASQMNEGASDSQYEILYFLHADTLPPRSFVADINAAMNAGKEMGGYRLKFTPSSLLLKINSFMTRFDTPFSGGGDQSLYISRDRFFSVNGFNERYIIMEDFELVDRLRPKTGYHIIPKWIKVSSRKYRNNNYFKVTLANYRAFKLFKKGVDPEIIKSKYYGWLRNIDREKI